MSIYLSQFDYTHRHIYIYIYIYMNTVSIYLSIYLSLLISISSYIYLSRHYISINLFYLILNSEPSLVCLFVCLFGFYQPF